ncbi:MAG: hypothetical protein JWL90_3168 [Chthoniobacteraceae bacterium]|nr:hypothetical protein [Chthoniobacteraceae bacterium]
MRIIGSVLILTAATFLFHEIRLLIAVFQYPDTWWPFSRYAHVWWLFAITYIGTLGFFIVRGRLSRSQRSLLLSPCVIFSIYAVSIGPALLWVTAPISSASTLDAYDRYDQRLSYYYCVYAPICWLRLWDGSGIWGCAFSFYDGFWARAKPPDGLATDTVDCPARYLPRFVDATRATDAVFYFRSELPDLFNQPGAFAYYLPRTHRFVLHGPRWDIDLSFTLARPSFEYPHVTPHFAVEMKTQSE